MRTEAINGPDSKHQHWFSDSFHCEANSLDSVLKSLGGEEWLESGRAGLQ